MAFLAVAVNRPANTPTRRRVPRGQRASRSCKEPASKRAGRVKKPASTIADTGKVAGGKPATGRLCQAGLRKIGRVSGTSPSGKLAVARKVPGAYRQIAVVRKRAPRTTPNRSYARSL